MTLVESTRARGQAIWAQIAQTLQDEITSGVVKPGEQLPPEADLAARFRVNRHTLRRAVAALAEAGAVRVEQGRGTFVAEDVIDYALGQRTRMSENLRKLDRTPGSTFLRAAEMPAPVRIARSLNIRAGRPVIQLETLSHADGRPLCLGSNYFPKARFDGIIEDYRRLGSITKALASRGIDDYFRKVTRIMAQMPDAGDARLLQQPRNQPVLVTESIDVDPAGTPIGFGIARFAAARIQLVVEN
ncbi:phosphonate metabolism transcriptional regulator PhnF [Oleomonas cavernae]|uniref:phosphonate metabolism transcriptional regulator PhnF n=1 Tax=Oleomonas cavernae TaxID=2320859 RepID=UPI001314CDBB|nr:phosphonate metabolism transcriptional regulator PhnF [Oleomonas cavernae]